MDDETLVERLTVISDLGNLWFTPPVFIEAGSRFRLVGDSLVVTDCEGAVRQIEGQRTERIPGIRYPKPQV